MPQMIARKDDVVSQTSKGIDFLMNKNSIDVYHGHGSFVSATKISVAGNDGKTQEIESAKTIIATGSKPITPAAFNYDKERIITSTEALNIQEVPATMTIIGAGVIGLELGSVYARLGTKVNVVEYADSIIGTMEADCGKELMRSLKKLGMKFHLKHSVTTVTSDGNSTKLTAIHRDKNTELVIDADYCLVAIGRRPYTDNLGLENAGVEKDERGRIKVDEHLQTTAAGIYAIGDVIQGAMLAHKAEEEGTLVAEYLAGQKPHINYNLIPGVVYTWPEVAAVGQTSAQLKRKRNRFQNG